MNIRLTLLVILLIVSNLSAQQPIDAQIQQISPLTPNAAALGKFGNTPVSLYTGIPNISIPIYEIKVRDFSLPISLNYHAGGIKVDDVASWVGMGWSLNAGGMISRQQRGTHDYKMVNENSTFYNDIETILSTSSTEEEKQDATFQLYSNGYDTESDIFSINTGTLSQKFFMDVDANTYCMPARKLQITPESSYSASQFYTFYARWRVKDEKGIEYIFGKTSDNTKEEFEITQSNQVCGASTDNPENVSSWYLNEIILPTGESIKFSYDYFSFCVESPVSETFIVEEINYSSSNTSTNYIKALRIKEITFPKGKIEFITGDLRRDFEGTNILDKINIYNLNSGVYELQKYFSLGTNNPIGNTITGDESFRLALLSITEKDKNGNSLEPYVFNYKNQVWDSYSFKLPTRGSRAQDLWGFHNGQVTNTSLVPNFLIRNEAGQIIGDVSGANRSVETQHAKAGILTKITYPTKGSTEFFYESNVAKGVTDSNDPNSINPVEQLLNMDIRATKLKMNNVQLLNTNGSDEKYGPEFEIYHEAGISVDFDSHIFYFDDLNQCTTTTPGGVGSFFECMDISLEKKNNSGVFVSINNTVYFDRSYHLDPGEYRIKLVWDDNSQIGSYGYVDLSWTDLTDPPEPVINDNTEMVVGGLRISKIVDHDPITNNDIVRNYNYNYDITDLPLIGSSGFIQNAPLHLYNKPYGYTYQGAHVVCSCQFLTSFSSSPILQTSGGFVGYEKVTVTYGANGEGGNSVSTFLSPKDYIDENISGSRIWPFNRTTSLDWRRGLNKNSIESKYEPNGYSKVSSINNDYIFNDNVNDVNYKNLNHIKIDTYPIFNPPPTTGVTYTGIYSVYQTKTESFYQNQSISTQYHSSGDVSTVSTTAIDDKTLQVASTTFTKSNGDVTEVLYKYPDDYANIDNLATLKANNIIAPPVKIEQTLNGNLVKGVVNTYNDHGQPLKVFTYEKEGSSISSPIHNENELIPPNYENKVDYIYNNGTQQLREIIPKNNISTYYIWGYNQQYPIAKIENFTSAQVSNIQNLINTALLRSNNDDDRTIGGNGNEGLLRSALDDIRKSSFTSAAMITTYTYDPLIGVTSITNPKGYTIYYEYDNFNRLQAVKDADGNLVSDYEYHYMGQN